MIQNTKAAKPANGHASGLHQVHISSERREKINMYDEPPRTTISLHEFQSMSMNRLQVLRKNRVYARRKQGRKRPHIRN